MRKAKQILITCLVLMQAALLLRSAFAVPMARGGFTKIDDPGYATPGAILRFSATAVNDGDATGWFRICVVRVAPSYHSYFPSQVDQVYDEKAVHCSKTLQLDPGETITHESSKWRMMSVPSETFWILLTVQQNAPIVDGSDDSDIINMAVDDLSVAVVTNVYSQ